MSFITRTQTTQVSCHKCIRAALKGLRQQSTCQPQSSPGAACTCEQSADFSSSCSSAIATGSSIQSCSAKIPSGVSKHIAPNFGAAAPEVAIFPGVRSSGQPPVHSSVANTPSGWSKIDEPCSWQTWSSFLNRSHRPSQFLGRRTEMISQPRHFCGHKSELERQKPDRDHLCTQYPPNVCKSSCQDLRVLPQQAC